MIVTVVTGRHTRISFFQQIQMERSKFLPTPDRYKRLRLGIPHWQTVSPVNAARSDYAVRLDRHREKWDRTNLLSCDRLSINIQSIVFYLRCQFIPERDCVFNADFVTNRRKNLVEVLSILFADTDSPAAPPPRKMRSVLFSAGIPSDHQCTFSPTQLT